MHTVIATAPPLARRLRSADRAAAGGRESPRLPPADLRPPVAPFDAPDDHEPRPPVPYQCAELDPQRRLIHVMKVMRTLVQPVARVVRAGEVIYRSGQPLTTVFLINAGAFKLVSRSLDGRDQIVSLKFRGDWLGFSGIAQGRHPCDAIAIDTGNIAIVPFDQLTEVSARHPEMMSVMLEALSSEIARERESLMSLCTLASLARVAEFLCAWARSMAQRGLRADELTLRMTRADLGNYLGMTLETVSRCLSRLAREELIRFGERGRRQISIPDLKRLERFVIGGSVPRSDDRPRGRSRSPSGADQSGASSRSKAAASASRV